MHLTSRPSALYTLPQTALLPVSEKMKDNFGLTLVGTGVQLVPYRKKFVQNYHAWMQDEYILEMTASEPLTIEEEYAMQESWRDDKKKCTFIVLHRSCDSESADGEDELERMAGDVNLFLSNSHEDDQLVAEIDIMIAEKKFRQRGLGREAVRIMMAYGATQLNITRFFAKISKDNTPSINLFKQLGYDLKNYCEAFGEYEYVYDARTHAEELNDLYNSVTKIDYLEEDL